MCLIVFALRVLPDYPLILAANRDEFYARPTAPAAPWDDAPGILAGRDLKSGGTWLGISASGRFAAVTNYRGPAETEAPRTRGALVSDFLRGRGGDPFDYVQAMAAEGAGYAGFNLLAGHGDTLAYCSNRGAQAQPVSTGIHALSNHLLDTPWPKVEAARENLQRLLAAGPPAPEVLLAMLEDTRPAADPALPETGVGVELERALSPPFVRTPDYGTRCSTYLALARDGRVVFAEREHTPGVAQTTRCFERAPGSGRFRPLELPTPAAAST